MDQKPYKALCAAIMRQAVDDYKDKKHNYKKDVTRFLNSDLCVEITDFLNLDRQVIKDHLIGN